MRLIVTRPEPDASRTADALRRLGHEPILSPMLDIWFDGQARLPEQPFQALLATSRNAIRALAAHPDRARLAGLPLLAVGDQTALEARRSGFAAARSAGGAMADLVALATSELRPAAGALLYLAGEDQAGDLASRLGEHGFQVDAAILYRAEARARLAPEAARAVRQGGGFGMLLYSGRSATAFAQAVRTDGLAPLPPEATAFCISAAAAEPVAPIAAGPVLVAARPDQLSLFALIEAAQTGSKPSAANSN